LKQEDSGELKQLYAVKTFKVERRFKRGTGEEDIEKLKKRKVVMKCIQREIDFLRELQFCDNVITLDSVYK